MDQGGHRGADQHERRDGQLLRGAQGRRSAVQPVERDRDRLGQEDQHEQDGVQVHGEHLGVPGVREEVWRAAAGNLPDGGPVGAPEPQLGGDLPAVARSQGRQVRQAVDWAEGGGQERAPVLGRAAAGRPNRHIAAVRIEQGRDPERHQLWQH